MSAFAPTLPAVTGSSPAALGTLPPPAGGESTLAGLAGQLGMSTEDLQSALKEGQSIAGLAEQQGIPRESVAGFISAQIQRARQYSGQPPLDQTALERMVDRALDRSRRVDTPVEDAARRPEGVALATYASNARAAAPVMPAGGTISLLA
jgi:hypothetical protein